MINIPVDEAYAFDYLSILELKLDNNYIPESRVKEVADVIISQIGKSLFDDIKSSIEYKNLYDANQLTFNAVDDAKTDKCTASYVDKCNYQRMIKKRELQEKWFDNSINETKIGYEKYE